MLSLATSRVASPTAKRAADKVDQVLSGEPAAGKTRVADDASTTREQRLSEVLW